MAAAAAAAAAPVKATANAFVNSQISLQVLKRLLSLLVHLDKQPCNALMFARVLYITKSEKHRYRLKETATKVFFA